MISTKEFPELYETKANGKTRQWKIIVEEYKEYSIIRSFYGWRHGKITETSKTINKGKNIGRSNETTHFQQAINEAEAKFNAKRDAGYNFEMNKTNENVILPMLALNYENRKKNIVFPCYIQAKLDGVRAIFNNHKLVSRKGKVFSHLEHILEQLSNCKLLLDGELYIHGEQLQDIVGIVRKEKNLTSKDIKFMEKVEFVVYDLVDTERDYKERLELLKNYFEINKFKNVRLLKTEIAKDSEQIDMYLQKYLQRDYEGLIIRNFKGVYQLNTRSKNLQKYKLFEDAEFRIVAFKEGTGISKGLVIWVCETDEGRNFDVVPEGKFEERKDFFKNGDKYIGKLLTVKYYGLTKDGIPKFANGISIRDYE